MVIQILFPAAIDNSISIPISIDNVTNDKAEVSNRLRAAILAIEASLGVNPGAVYGTVRARLDYLEAIVTGQVPPSFLGGDLAGTFTNAFVVGLQGNPISNAIVSSGQLYIFNGTEWVPQDAPSGTFSAGGDLSGTGDNQTVIGIQTIPVSSVAPTAGQVLEYNGSQYAPTTPSSGFTAGGDLRGTNTDQIVQGLQTYPIATTIPVQNAVPVYDTDLAEYDIRKLTLDDLGPAFAITGFSGSSTVEIGATVTNPSFTASYSSVPTSANITNTDNIDSPLTLITPFTSGTVVGAFHHTTQTSVTFTLTAVAATTQHATQSISYLPRMFGGVGSAGATSSVTASGSTAILSTGDILASEGLSSNPIGAIYTLTPVLPPQKFYLLLTGGSHTFKDNSTGFAFPFNAPTAVSFTNQNSAVVAMYLYESQFLQNSPFNILVAS